MKRILTSTAMIAMLAAPALAGDAKMDTKAKGDKAAAGEKAHQAETIHPPTNRVGKQVPTMTDRDGDVHPPTNRVGENVPTMSADEEKKAAEADKPDKSKPSQN